MGAESVHTRESLTLEHFTVEERRMIKLLCAGAGTFAILTEFGLPAFRIYRSIVRKFKAHDFDKKSIAAGDATEWYDAQIAALVKAKADAAADQGRQEKQASSAADDMLAMSRKKDKERREEEERRCRERDEYNKRVEEYNRRPGRGLKRHRRVV